MVSTIPVMAIARVFKFGKCRAVRLPKQFQLDVQEVQIFRRGDEVVLKPLPKPKGISRAFHILAGMPEDFFPDDTQCSDAHPVDPSNG